MKFYFFFTFVHVIELMHRLSSINLNLINWDEKKQKKIHWRNGFSFSFIIGNACQVIVD